MEKPDNPVELAEVTAELFSEASSGVVDSSKVLGWMKSKNIEVLGAVFRLLHKREHYSRITPPLTLDDYQPFHLLYYERCLREDPDSVWTDSRYLAAHSLLAWLKGLLKEQKDRSDTVLEVKSMLARLYREGNERLQECIITGFLEHALQDSDVSELFIDWKSDPTLKEAYAEASMYAARERSRERVGPRIMTFRVNPRPFSNGIRTRHFVISSFDSGR